MASFRKRGNACQAIVRIKQGGSIVHQESRTFTDPNPARAERLARDWAVRLEVNIKQNGAPQRGLKVVTLGGLLRRYQEQAASIKPLRRAMEHELAQLAVSFDDVTLSALSAFTFTEYATKRRTEGAGPTTILHNLSTVRSVLNAARPMFNLDVDGTRVAEALAALDRLGVVGKSESRDRRPSSDELARLDAEFKRIAPHPSTIIPMDRVVALAVAFPRRLGELTSMRWVDRKGDVMTLYDTKHPTKPRTERVPLPPRAVTIIDALPIIDERMLPYKSESVSASFQRACKRLEIADLHFHDLRHEGITQLFEMGLDIQHVAMVSGHQSWNMLRRYTHLKPATVLEKMNGPRA